MKTQENILLLADAYKYSHHKLYYPGTTKIYSYLESRGGQFDETVFFGLQYFLKYYLQGEVITTEKIDAAAGFLQVMMFSTGVSLTISLKSMVVVYPCVSRLLLKDLLFL
jgi:nicotinamide phosphoribosyltransferase